MARAEMPRKTRPAAACAAIALALVWSGARGAEAGDGPETGAVQWPRFRGPGGSGVAPGGDFPLRFGPETNRRWRQALPRGHSSPCIWGRRLFVTAFADGKLETRCFDRRDGRCLWTRRVEPGEMEKGSRHSSPAASTPCADGGSVYVYFAPFGLLAYEHTGEERWRRPLPTPVTQHGASSSPVVTGGTVVLACDQDVGSFLLAVDARDGTTRWRTERRGYRRGFATPLLWPRDEPEAAILAGTLRLAAYDLEDGGELWTARGLPNEMVASPVAGDGLVFAGGWTYGSGVAVMPDFDALLEAGDADGDGRLTRDEAPSGPATQHFVYVDADKDGSLTRGEWESLAEIFETSENALIAVRPGGRGDVTGTRVVWKQTRGIPYVPSPLYYRGRVFVVKKGGIASSFDAATGEPSFHQERLGALGDYYASPVAAAGKILTVSYRGRAVVLEAGDELEVLARNDLGETVLATPAIAGDALYVRTTRHLYCFARDGTPDGSAPED